MIITVDMKKKILLSPGELEDSTVNRDSQLFYSFKFEHIEMFMRYGFYRRCSYFCHERVFEEISDI